MLIDTFFNVFLICHCKNKVTVLTVSPFFFFFCLMNIENCGDPPRLDGAILDDQYIDKKDFPVNVTVSYSCLPGYIRDRMVNNTISCLSDSTWSTAKTFCQRKYRMLFLFLMLLYVFNNFQTVPMKCIYPFFRSLLFSFFNQLASAW